MEFLFVGGDAEEKLTALILLFGSRDSYLFILEANQFLDIFFSVDFLSQFLDDGGFEGRPRDAGLGTFAAFAIGECAKIGLVFVASLLM